MRNWLVLLIPAVFLLVGAFLLVLGLEQEFGIKVQDEEVGVKAFASVTALCDFIEQKRAS